MHNDQLTSFWPTFAASYPNHGGLDGLTARRCLTLPDLESFPLDRSGRLTRNVISHARNASNLVHYAI